VLILVISRVIVPSNHGSIKPAVECITTHNLQIELLPSHLATKSAGIFIFSIVTQRTKSQG